MRKKKDLEFLQAFVFFQRMLKAGEKSSTALPNTSLSWSSMLIMMSYLVVLKRLYTHKRTENKKNLLHNTLFLLISKYIFCFCVQGKRNLF